MLFFLIIIVIISYLISRRLYNNILNPVYLFIGVNIFSILLSLLQNIKFEYSLQFDLTIFIMFIAYLLGILIGVKKNQIENSSKIVFYKNIYIIIIIFSIIYNLALIAYLKNLFSEYSIIEFFIKLNEINASVQDEEKTHWFSYLVPLGFPLIILCIYYRKNYKKTFFLNIQIVLCLLFCISPRRENLFNMILLLLIFLISNNINHKIKNYNNKIFKYSIITVILVVIIMSWTQELLNKSSDASIMICGLELPSIFTTPYGYISLNYPYLQLLDFHNSWHNYPIFLASGRLFYILLNKIFNLNLDYPEAFSLDFINIDNYNITNTAPLLYYSFLDLGIFFFIDFIILGFISQRAYYYYVSNNIIKKIIGSLWMVVLLLSFRSYLLIYLQFVLAFFYTIIIGIFLKKKYNEKNFSNFLPLSSRRRFL